MPHSTIKPFFFHTQLDEDGNGKISMAELGYALETVGIKVPGFELRQIMASFDTSGDGCIDMEEFKSVSHMICSFIATHYSCKDIVGMHKMESCLTNMNASVFFPLKFNFDNFNAIHLKTFFC